mmetsp:Transcript_81467/g.216216  ORF Transcript_81467/g.216216 Transcript_81467/m.216216 type:complete len:211 (-) Transcript_81467:820-1452(-)
MWQTICGSMSHSWHSPWLSLCEGASMRMFSSRPVPYHSFSCCGEPKQRNWPEHWIPMRVHKASASSMECVVRTTALELRLIATVWITSHMRRRARGSMPAEGSSKNTTSGSPMSAMAVESLRLLPPLSWPARESVYSERCRVSSLLATSSSSTLPVKPLMRANNSRCSCTVMSSNKASNCGQYPMCFRTPCKSSDTSMPLTKTRPDEGTS